MNKKAIKGFLNDESGQDLVEYSLLLTLVGAASLIVLSAMGVSINKIFAKINDLLNNAANTIS